ncbi:DUF1800 domain-containing protein [Psychromonas sp. RZ22]|uniref:DUF1800 domain-containing protein n=1 Tax=Psychromonas algarum TaxID=2555643 RepID=UPI001068C81E|nr:DUF1800 domain-containing protein [Psychromonas sp. RZ22]TEW53729.1 DUF1800 domain-containing protein [Psychromonas sp. RZ22]
MQAIQPPSNKQFTKATIAMQRFALGARPNDIKRIENIAQPWLLNQLTFKPAVEFDSTLPDSNEILIIQEKYKQAQKAFKEYAKHQPITANMSDNKDMQPPKNPNQAIYKQLTADALQQSINSFNSFNWRCLDFFSNHFSVSTQGSIMRGLAPTLEREAIAPHLFGRFEDLLLAVYQHPAMLIYLNNETSIGPSTKYAKMNKGLNENLAREILELHTLGVNSGYQQKDVTELAKGITGWSVARPGKEEKEGFVYRANKHEPGIRTLMGKSFPESGMKQGTAMIKYLANHPITARFVSTKIIQHFISDQAPEELINHLTTHWYNSNGQLSSVFQALIQHPLSWQIKQQKYKTPREYVISTYRALNIKNLSIKQVQSALSVLGEEPFKAGSPAGYSDQQQDWDGANALMARINWASQLAGRKASKRIDIETLISNTFGDTLSTHSYQVITRAESRQQALTLLLLSPEFLRR